MARSERDRLGRIRPLAEFLRTEAGGGAVLVAAALVALVWANSPWRDAYTDLWSHELSISVGSRELTLDLRHWVNDALMVGFFFVVGLEIKRELVLGELRDRRRAALPVFGAIGGMAVPALLYVAVAGDGPVRDGWGIPMATDIAVAVGVVALLGSRVHPSLKLFLLALAIVDDIGAIVVIALFYSGSVDLEMLALAVATVIALVAMRLAGVRWIAAYVAVGACLWLALHESGVHATLAGVVCGLLTPTDIEKRGQPGVSVLEWLEHVVHPWTSFVVVPAFALANAGVWLGDGVLGDAANSRVTIGVVVGLVLGKPIGISLASWVAVRSGVGALPDGTTWRALIAVASIAGIGFTVSLFVAELAFAHPSDVADAKVGVLAASVASAVLGAALVRSCSRR